MGVQIPPCPLQDNNMNLTTDPKSWKVGDVFVYSSDKGEEDSQSVFYVLGKVVKTSTHPLSISVFYKTLYATYLKSEPKSYQDTDLFDTTSSACMQNSIFNIKDDLERAFRTIKKQGKLKETLKSIFMRSL